jgi:agmatinase
LRDTYEGTPYSHACVARRLLELDGIEQVLQLGIRSVCTEEVQYVRQHPQRARVWYAEQVHAGGWLAEFVQRIRGRRVYLTIDVDGLDPAIVPATGTPEPDGLTWAETLYILRTLAANAKIVGLDCVELAPQESQHAADYAVAKLIYKTISYARGYTA